MSGLCHRGHTSIRSVLEVVVKSVAVIGAVESFILMFSYWSTLQSNSSRFVLSAIIPGYAVLYTAFVLNEIREREPDRHLNRVFALYGIGAYFTAAAVCLQNSHLEKWNGGSYFLAAAGLAVVEGIILAFEAVLLMTDQRNRNPAVAARDSHLTPQNRPLQVVKGRKPLREPPKPPLIPTAKKSGLIKA